MRSERSPKNCGRRMMERLAVAAVLCCSQFRLLVCIGSRTSERTLAAIEVRAARKLSLLLSLLQNVWASKSFADFASQNSFEVLQTSVPKRCYFMHETVSAVARRPRRPLLITLRRPVDLVRVQLPAENNRNLIVGKIRSTNFPLPSAVPVLRFGIPSACKQQECDTINGRHRNRAPGLVSNWIFRSDVAITSAKPEN